MPKALVLAQAGKLRCAFPGASLSTMPWLLDREEYELIQVGVYGAYLWQLGAQGAPKLADLGRLVMQYIDARLDDVKQRLDRLERWQARLTCWWQLVSVVWHSVWALERGKEWEQAVITLQWLIRILPSQLQSPSRKAKYLHRLRIDLSHLGRQADFPYMLAEATVEEIDLERPDSLLPDPIIRLPGPEKVALSGGVPPHIVVNEYDIVDCGAGRAYGRVEAATLDHLGWPGVHDEGV
ncbi:hypothetical protein Pmar_PMAR025782 [Perkinsus marinus ATCC 50983]|uniref:Uncharacterized protein n=1 Tax=Perkinsus marinus (strain ATCC 50983 / TXsc) TaxID=423536 RepID=C5L4A4_PERM5|nr:hypothetical protein Pmar_PMAR025782 [Perkinsus marinus ATCC 50983]EER08439.1 hypothetical protein Pmar_PMAR025782 [Perkinsus marinus ATCC 50983]|eukprot:XP_002776623.1 hypothetical protein Pmar_PMAR025782 [Perkinsus marinus ATCC 50983]